MLTELRKKSQITIPKRLIDKLGLSEGDKLEISEKDGAIYIMPVVVYPKNYIDELKDEIEDIKRNIELEKQPIFENIDELFENLDTD